MVKTFTIHMFSSSHPPLPPAGQNSFYFLNHRWIYVSLWKNKEQKTNQPKVLKFEYKRVTLCHTKHLPFLLLFSNISGVGLPLDDLLEQSWARGEKRKSQKLAYVPFECAKINETLLQLWSSECPIFTEMIQDLCFTLGRTVILISQLQLYVFLFHILNRKRKTHQLRNILFCESFW